MHYNRRRHERECCQTPIAFSEYGQTDYFEATMYDKSKNGVSFASDTEIQSGLPVCIVLPSREDATEQLHTSEAYVARVKWQRKEVSDNHYKMGAQLMYQGYMRTTEETIKIYNTCELCGKKLNGEVYLTDEPLNLCLGCFKYLGGVLEANTRDSVIRFMLGNVV